MLKKAQSTGIIVFIVILIIVFLITNNTMITYAQYRASGQDLYCDNNIPKVRNDIMGLGSSLAQTEAAIACYSYRTSNYEFVCKNDIVYFNCRATIWNVYVSKS